LGLNGVFSRLWLQFKFGGDKLVAAYVEHIREESATKY
jgi:hypothetical protein